LRATQVQNAAMIPNQMATGVNEINGFPPQTYGVARAAGTSSPVESTPKAKWTQNFSRLRPPHSGQMAGLRQLARSTAIRSTRPWWHHGHGICVAILSIRACCLTSCKSAAGVICASGKMLNV
jgi:hypothetical protein